MISFYVEYALYLGYSKVKYVSISAEVPMKYEENMHLRTVKEFRSFHPFILKRNAKIL